MRLHCAELVEPWLARRSRNTTPIKVEVLYAPFGRGLTIATAWLQGPDRHRTASFPAREGRPVHLRLPTHLHGPAPGRDRGANAPLRPSAGFRKRMINRPTRVNARRNVYAVGGRNTSCPGVGAPPAIFRDWLVTSIRVVRTY